MTQQAMVEVIKFYPALKERTVTYFGEDWNIASAFNNCSSHTVSVRALPYDEKLVYAGMRIITLSEID